jgi:hypothetical protein
MLQSATDLATLSTPKQTTGVNKRKRWRRGNAWKEATMAVYTFYMHESREAVPSFEIQLFDTVDPALDHGKRLLKERPRYNFIEIISGDDSVAKLTREAL